MIIEEITRTVSKYTNIPAEQLNNSTVIDRSAVKNSILLHRMYAELARKGIEVSNYQEIQTFGELVRKNERQEGAVPNDSQFNYMTYTSDIVTPGQCTAGIDIEEIGQMPKANDFREDDFYRMNFSQHEISYCILQPDPYSSFTGLYAAKEAIVKADNNYSTIPFNQISITHSANGRPGFSNFAISISHTSLIAVAVVIRDSTSVSSLQEIAITNRSSLNILSGIAIILSLIAICISLFI